MDFKILTYTSAMPEYQWINQIIFDVVWELPAQMFDELIPWRYTISQLPFIHKFSIEKAMEATNEANRQKTYPNVPIFPLDSRISEINLRKFMNSRPFRVMILGDTQPLFYELSTLLATEFDTNLITPESLIKQEIDQRTEIGIALEDIINKRKRIPAWVAMILLEKELEKEKYSMAGFILTGFPIISNMNTNKPKNSENMQFFDKEYTYPEGSEKEVIKYCAELQIEYIRRFFGIRDYIIYLANNNYTEKYAETIDIIQKFVIRYFREKVTRVDCRIGLNALFNSIKNGFKYINYKVNYKCVAINESHKETLDDFGEYETILPESQQDTLSLDNLCATETILPNYKWCASKFGKICPVNLFHGRLRFCNSKFPVRFLKYIFMCYSEEDRKQFIQNPSKYMVIIPKCRIAVIGPHKSGKTTLSRVLAKFFQAEVYNEHIHKSEDKHRHYNPIKELNILQKKHEEENEIFRNSKILEWNECVMNELNDIFSTALQGENKAPPKIDWFTPKIAADCFPSLNLIKPHTSVTRELLQEEMVFHGSLNLAPENFLSWLESKPESNKHKYKQYVLDSPPIKLSFWNELLDKDELPDCVLFLSISSIKKLFDIYSGKHEELCVNDKNIIERIISQTSYLDDMDIWSMNIPVDHSKARISHKYNPVDSSSFIKERYETAMKFVEKYEELKEFFRLNNVPCFDIDISKHKWSKSIEKALFNYITLNYIKAYSGGYEYEIVYEEEMEKPSGSSTSLLNCEEQNDDIHSLKSFDNDFNYGSCLDWCPVSLVNERILKKGNSLFSATFKNKVYAMHTSAALHAFMSTPGFYTSRPFSVPPPRIFVIGPIFKNKINFAESLAAGLNVECYCYKHSPFSVPLIELVTENLTIDLLEILYASKNDQFFETLSTYYDKGTVLTGYPFLMKQFKNMISRNFHPECVLSFHNSDETYEACYGLFARYHKIESLKGRRGFDADLLRSSMLNKPTKTNIAKYLRSLSEDERQNIVTKSRRFAHSLDKEIHKIEEECLKLGIPILRLPQLYKQPKKILALVQSINNYRAREAMFEKVKQITIAESEVLLKTGYYRFSRFKYSCPVDVGRLVTLNSFTGKKAQNRVYPCIYLDFIYFLCGEKNLKDFKRNPLEYINTCNPPQLTHPIRIAVCGASKSGISTICQTAAYEFGFKILRPNDNSNVIDLLKMERYSTPNGIILDNFALTPEFLLEAALNTVDITIVFVIVSSFEKLLDNWFMQNRNKKTNAQVSLLKLFANYSETSKKIEILRKSNATSLLNIHYIDGDASSWAVWDKVENIILRTANCKANYKIKLLKNRCASLAYLNMFYQGIVFQREINHYYCQACLASGRLKAFKYYYVNVGPEFYSDICQNMFNQPYAYLNTEIYQMFNITHPFEYNDYEEPLSTQAKYIMCRFQIVDRFYWTCSDHTINFMLNTRYYYDITPKLKPLYIPFLVIGYNKESLAFQGYCPVEYERGRFFKGSIKLSVYYRRKVYVMKNIENTHEFLMYPEKYRKLKFDPCNFTQKGKFKGMIPETLITEIVLEISKARPIHFALDARLSACTLIALHLCLINSAPQHTYHWKDLINTFKMDCKKYQDDVKQWRKKYK